MSEKAEIQLDARSKDIVDQFIVLMEKSRTLFDGLRDLPQFCHSHWQSHFGRAFDLYTKLWKFQQENRSTLDKFYNLKRWQIGEIASKIGQLYYHYYLRTSETNYLFEAFQFYSAIRSRNYFNQLEKEEEKKLLPKKLRYYARFLVVCLLLNEADLVRDLVKEMKKYINAYADNANDQDEWQLVLKEALAFTEADNVLTVLEENLSPYILKHRVILDQIPSIGVAESSRMKLKEVMIIGNCEKQIKFSELTLDMFRFLQCVEKMPGSLESYSMKVSSSGLATEQVDEGNDGRRNPHKYLLYKPSFGQLVTFLGAAYKDLPNHSVMLIYLSADGCSDSKRTNDDQGFYESGGVTTRKPKSSSTKRSGNVKESNCLYPEDIIPFTRKPLVVIVDSSNSQAFRNLPKLFGQPFLCLMSPAVVPQAFANQNSGGLLTLFLYDPLLAFCVVCKANNIRKELWEQCQHFLDKISSEILEILCSFLKDLDMVFDQFIGDEFLRLIIIRFIFCYEVLRLHKDFKGAAYYPLSSPSISKDIFTHKGLARHVLELASLLDMRHAFHELTEIAELEAISYLTH